MIGPGSDKKVKTEPRDMGNRRGKNKEIHYAKHLKTPFCSNCVPSLGPMTKCQDGWMLLKLTTNSSNSDS